MSLLLTEYICFELQNEHARKRKSSEYGENEDMAEHVSKAADRSTTSRRSTSPLHDRPNDSRITKTPQTAREDYGNSKRASQPVDKLNRSDRDMTPECVLGACPVEELTFLIKFKNPDATELIPARIANVKWPQLVIQFYEQRQVWKSPERKIRCLKRAAKITNE